MPTRRVSKSMPRWMRVLSASSAALVLTLMAGCTPADPATQSSSSPSASATPTPQELASGRGEGPLGPVDVTVRSLTLDDNGTTMTLRAAFTPQFAGDPKSRVLSAINDYWTLTPVLLDRENLKRYNVLRGFGQDLLMNQDSKTTSGEPLEMWFVFAAPEDDIASIELTIDEWSLELADIPITAAE